MNASLPEGPWYHGSPAALTALRPGSLVTPFEAVARAFSHRPRHLSFDSDPSQVKHDGQVPGFLYVVDENLAPGDLVELPGTASTHWEARRELRVRQVAEVPVDDPPRLTPAERAEMDRRRAAAGGGVFLLLEEFPRCGTRPYRSEA